MPTDTTPHPIPVKIFFDNSFLGESILFAQPELHNQLLVPLPEGEVLTTIRDTAANLLAKGMSDTLLYYVSAQPFKIVTLNNEELDGAIDCYNLMQPDDNHLYIEMTDNNKAIFDKYQ